ncbi:MAG: hypothetical protein KatS3mg102_0607 [Planctomycetota bacterium]|nr:MAG: hypothetical protein KatS3mg102_0607 [Planctomycetota bacterium]
MNVPPHRRPPTLRLLWRAEGWAVLDKPAGLAVAGERNRPGGRTPLLEAAAAALGVEHVLVVHRLDRDTTGCLVVATNPAAHRALSLAFQQRRVVKTYLGLVEGVPQALAGQIDAPLERDPRGGSRMRVARPGRLRPGAPRPRAARTRWRLLVPFRRHALLALWPETGRQHQLRVHLRQLGHPLVGDPLYGGAEREGLRLSALKPGYRPARGRAERPLVQRPALHAWKLLLPAPEPGCSPLPAPDAAIRVRAPLPQDLRRALRQLLRFARTAPRTRD